MESKQYKMFFYGKNVLIDSPKLLKGFIALASDKEDALLLMEKELNDFVKNCKDGMHPEISDGDIELLSNIKLDPDQVSVFGEPNAFILLGDPEG